MRFSAFCWRWRSPSRRRVGPLNQGKGWLRARALPLGTVVVSYCLMFAFVDEDFLVPMRVHLRFFARLLGIPA